MSVSTLFPYYVEARKVIQENREGYAQACREWAEQGLRPAYCIHDTPSKMFVLDAHPPSVLIPKGIMEKRVF